MRSGRERETLTAATGWVGKMVADHAMVMENADNEAESAVVMGGLDALEWGI